MPESRDKLRFLYPRVESLSVTFKARFRLLWRAFSLIAMLKMVSR